MLGSRPRLTLSLCLTCSLLGSTPALAAPAPSPSQTPATRSSAPTPSPSAPTPAPAAEGPAAPAPTAAPPADRSGPAPAAAPAPSPASAPSPSARPDAWPAGQQTNSEEPSPPHPARVRWALDASLTVGAGASFLVINNWVSPQLPVDAGPQTELIAGPDSVAIGHYRPKVARASDVLLISGAVAPLIYHGIESGLRRDRFWARYGADLMIYSEALAINLLATEILKVAVGRPRPFTHVDPNTVDPEVRDELIAAQAETDSRKSFPSGHSSLAFAAAVAGSTLLTFKLAKRNPAAVVVTWILSIGAATTTGALRVVAGKHYPSDVVAGALLGTTVGLVVPLAHFRGRLEPRDRPSYRVQLSPTLGPTRGLAITGRF